MISNHLSKMVETVPMLTPHLPAKSSYSRLRRSLVRVMNNWFSKLMTHGVELAKGEMNINK